MRFAVLGSGSSGNSCLIEAGGARVLVDAGLSAKRLTDRLAMRGVCPSTLDAILLTHEHIDHIKGLKVLLKKHSGVPVYATAPTARVVRECGVGGAWKIFEAGNPFLVGEVLVESFSIQHDAVDPVGYVFRHNGCSMGLLSDAGHVTANVIERLRGVHSLFVEANYDDDMLIADTKRPWSLKQRISSRHGHLSNKQTAELIAELAHAALARVVLGHLSRDCNRPDVALAVIRKHLAGCCSHQFDIHCAAPDEPTPWWPFMREVAV